MGTIEAMKRGWVKAIYRNETVWAKWHPKSPVNKRSRCEEVWHKGDRWVPPDDPRCQIDNEMGKERVNSHKKKTLWVCQVCAIDIPHKPEPDNQTGWDLG